MPTAAVIGGSAVLGAISSRNATKSAARAQSDAADKSAAQIAASTAKARGDLFKLFPAAQQNTQQGYQGALDVFSQALPQQANTFQAGNVAAQNQLLTGMPQFQNAILGAPVDYSKFQATQLEQPNFGFANQQLEYTDPYEPPQQQQLYGTGNVPNYSAGPNYSNGQPSDRTFNYNDILSRRF